MDIMKRKIRKNKMEGVRTLAIGFFVVIFIGGLILSTPICSVSGNSTNLLDSLFTSTSAVCVTGLVTVDTGTHWNTVGQVIIMTLIEIGGLGFMSITTFVAVLLGRKITLRDRLIVKESMNTFTLQGLVKMVRRVIIFTISVQLAGAAILSTQFIPIHGVKKGIFFSIFHSVSAFCNAGFDLNGGFSSLTGYTGNRIILLTLSLLIVIGGLGFSVILELLMHKKHRKISVHTKLVLVITSVLIVGGAIIMFLVEHNNPDTLGNMNFIDKTVNSLFASITPRTAGFNSIATDKMTEAGNFLTIILMFIGGSPGSTAGGLKTTTIGLIFITAISIIKGREDAEAFGRSFSKEVVYKAFVLLMIGVSIVMFVTMVLTVTEQGESFLSLLYESASAFGTAGLTMGVTQRLSLVGKLIIMISMYLGRVGPLTVVLALTRKTKKVGYKYPEGKILIG